MKAGESGRNVWPSPRSTPDSSWRRLLPSPAGRATARPACTSPASAKGFFRVHVLDAYGFACAVTGEHSVPVLEAAHIKPYAKGGEHDVANGLSLRTDIHRLFDKGYVTVDQQSKFVVSDWLKTDFKNGRSYYNLAGRTLELPEEAARRPSNDALAWHRESVFLG